VQALTKRQKLILDFIKNFIQERGFSPSYQEIARGMGLSSQSTVHVHVENLRDKGYLTKKWNANRSIDLVDADTSYEAAPEIPLVGRIAAGEPIEAMEDIETISVPRDMIGRNDTYVLRVKGDSMIEDHVLEGDYIVVEKRDLARDGEMVVALVKDNEATLKRFRRDRDKIRLEPANPAYKPMIFDEKDVKIQGVVIGILRKYAR